MRIAPEGTSITELDQWDIFYDAKDRDSVLSAVVTSVVRPKTLNGLYWELKFEDADGVRGVVPSSETGLPSERTMNFFVNQKVNVKIKSIDRKNGIVACTRREVVEEAINHLLGTLTEGEEIPALVRFVSRRGVGLDIGGGVIVEVPYRNAAYSRSLPLDVIYRPGQLIRVTVQAIDKEKKDIRVSIKDPWENEEFSRGTILTGRVLKIRGREMFVEVRQGLVGLAGYPLNKRIEEGEQLPFQVMSFDRAERKLHLIVLDPERIRGRRVRRERRIREAKR
ncbi:hypothetical protein [Desulfofundulus salinus]|uniref:30S ribosomal protein S1 n=1 Tax=Desulfofundulus salinus TaxID=2419843 RepID=A0A494WSL4_9FIRM|nr:hypothetical protein [Desulfofundulus salinum]RKO65733.1 30S ribosomal protein S1 [Desulfofundulus salinum]